MIAPCYEHQGNKLYHGDCRRVLADLPENSIDACVTDPPYNLGFMGKSWDSTGVAFQPETWAAVLRCMKPGGCIVAFGGTRTYHRMACAIEDAGFEIRDSIACFGWQCASLEWVYGSGFPKSLDIGKAIDKAAGAVREVVGARPIAYPDSPSGYASFSANSTARSGGIWNETEGAAEHGRPITAPATDAARQWQGWGTALKPAHEPIILARKPLAGTVAENVVAWGTGGINVDACRVTGPASVGGSTSGETALGQGSGWNAHENRPTAIDRSMAMGRFPPNLVLCHHPDCRPCGERQVKGSNFDRYGRPHRSTGNVYGDHQPSEFKGYADVDGLETVTAWQCVAGCPVAELDRQSGDGKDGVAGKRSGIAHVTLHGLGATDEPWGGYGGQGGASRFFPQFSWTADDLVPFLYCPKASRRERDCGTKASSKLKLRSDLTDEQRAYVIQELKAAGVDL
jgi:hypothetical protein